MREALGLSIIVATFQRRKFKDNATLQQGPRPAVRLRGEGLHMSL